MIVKRKNSSLQSREALKNIEDNTEDNVKSGSSTNLLKKAKAYNSLPFEFKGWVDIKYVELFQGLKGTTKKSSCDTTIATKRTEINVLLLL